MKLNLLYALAIGDGHVYCRRDSRWKGSPLCAGLAINHSLKQIELLEYKRNIISQNLGGIPNIRHFNNNGYPGVMFTKSHSVFKEIHKNLYPNNKKTISRNILDTFDAECLAIWYMDDGGLGIKKRLNKIHGYELFLNTHLSKEENQIIIDYFKETWDIQFTQVKNRNHYRLRCGTKEGSKFIKIIKPFVVNSLLYKIDPFLVRPNNIN